MVAGDADMGEDVEDPELMAALAMSMSDFAGGSAAAPASEAAAPATSTPQVGACAVLIEHCTLPQSSNACSACHRCHSYQAAIKGRRAC